jgi:hypothetical protein
MTGDEVAVMIVPTPTVDLALDAELVREVIPFERWNGPSVAVQKVWLHADVEGGRRILLVARRDRVPLAIDVSGDVRLRHVPRSSVLAVPSPLDRHVRWVSHVIITDGKAPVLLLDPEHLE